MFSAFYILRTLTILGYWKNIVWLKWEIDGNKINVLLSNRNDVGDNKLSGSICTYIMSIMHIRIKSTKL